MRLIDAPGKDIKGAQVSNIARLQNKLNRMLLFGKSFRTRRSETVHSLIPVRVLTS